MFDGDQSSGPADSRQSETVRRPSSAHRSRSSDLRGLSIWTAVWAAFLLVAPLVSLPAVEAPSVVWARQSRLRRHDEPGVVCIATPDLAFDDGCCHCISWLSGDRSHVSGHFPGSRGACP